MRLLEIARCGALAGRILAGGMPGRRSWLTFMFLMIILGATDRRAPQGFAPITIWLGLTLIHLFRIPVTNLSVNPAAALVPLSSSAVGPCSSSGCSGWRPWRARPT